MSKTLYLILALLCSQASFAQSDFITLWDMSQPGGAATELQFDLYRSGATQYSWREISLGNATGSGTFPLGSGQITISGLPAGSILELSITPEHVNSLSFMYQSDAGRLMELRQWGSIAWGVSMAYAFSGCYNMTITAADIPDLSHTEYVYNMFSYCDALGKPANMNSWDMSNIKNTSFMFAFSDTFDQDISSWDLSNVEYMTGMFIDAPKFNQNIGSWDVSKAISLSNMFYKASDFNQDIGAWNVASATDLGSMFTGASSFNQNLSAWAARMHPEVVLTDFLRATGMDTKRYDSFLIALNAEGPTGRTMSAPGQKYCSALAARENLTLPVAGGGKGWTITGDVYECPLPVTLVSFSGKSISGRENRLQWVTSSEENFDRFEVERSEDARSFEKIGFVVNAKEDRTALRSYQFVDRFARPGSYYRLKMIDLDGTSEFSKIITIYQTPDETIVGSFYPNPAPDVTSVDVFAAEAGEWTVTVSDISGNVSEPVFKMLQKGMNKIDLGNLRSGLNIVKFEHGGTVEVRRLLKK